MNSGDKSIPSSPSSSKGSGGKITKKKRTKAPQRGMGVAKLEQMRLSSLGNPYQQEFHMGGQGLPIYHSVYAPSQAQQPLYHPFGYHQQPNPAINFGASREVNILNAAHIPVDLPPSSRHSLDRGSATGSNSTKFAQSMRLHQWPQQQPHLVQPVMESPRPTFSLTSHESRSRDIETKEDIRGKRQRREEGTLSGDEEIDLELKL